jgi:hypothetical protein
MGRDSNCREFRVARLEDTYIELLDQCPRSVARSIASSCDDLPKYPATSTGVSLVTKVHRGGFVTQHGGGNEGEALSVLSAKQE